MLALSRLGWFRFGDGLWQIQAGVGPAPACRGAWVSQACVDPFKACIGESFSDRTMPRSGSTHGSLP